MSNMSYCRFQNTYHDVEDCYEALQALFDGTDGEGEVPQPLSKDELDAAKHLVSLCQRITELFGDEVEFETFLDQKNEEAAKQVAMEG